MKYLINVAYVFAAAAYSGVLLYKRIRHNRYQFGWDDRLGKIRRKDPDKKCIWIHAVSVGEVNATRTIVNELQKKFSELDILISTTTDTGYARAKAVYGDDLDICFFPMDFSWTMSRAFRNIDPAICILMELEVWPNFAHIAHELNVPVVVANGRISDRSFGRYKKVKPIAKAMFKRIDLILAQTQDYERKFIEVGCPAEKVITTGSLKYDTAQITNRVDGSDELEKQLNIAGKKLWVAGGTGNDEEKLIIDVYKKIIEQEKFKDLRLAIIPRKPERFDEVAQMIQQEGFSLIRYSQLKSKNQRPETNDKRPVILGDTMGDLRKFYSLATIIFVGRSLVPMGGSDMLEAAALGKCTMFGPHAFNFKQTVDALLDGNGALLVNDTYELQKAMEKCLEDETYCKDIAEKGQQVIIDNQGATAKTTEKISMLLFSSK